MQDRKVVLSFVPWVVLKSNLFLISQNIWCSDTIIPANLIKILHP